MRPYPRARVWRICFGVCLLISRAPLVARALCPLVSLGADDPLPGSDGCPRVVSDDPELLSSRAKDSHAWIGDAISEGLERDGLAFLNAGGNLSDTELLSILARLGEPYHESNAVMNIEPKEDAQFIAQTREGIEFHHEVAYMEHPPRFLALYCKKNTAQGGSLLLCDARQFQQGLDPMMRALMRQTKFVNTIVPSSGAMPLIRPMPSLGGEERFIFSSIGINRSDMFFHPAPGFEDGGELIMEILRPFLTDCPNMQRIVWHPGDLVVVDNLRVMHARYEFDDGERELAHVRIA